MGLSRHLEVDPIACEGHGLCAQLLPERITLDDWGYPIVDSTPVGRDLLPHARRAVSACPVLALRLEAAFDRAARERYHLTLIGGKRNEEQVPDRPSHDANDGALPRG